MESKVRIKIYNILYFQHILTILLQCHINKFGVNVKSERNDVKINLQRNKKHETGAYRAVKQNFEFIETFGKLIGAKINYEWKGGPPYWFAVSYLIFTWSQFFYSQYKYTKNGEYKKILEVFAVYGVAASVI